MTGGKLPQSDVQSEGTSSEIESNRYPLNQSPDRHRMPFNGNHPSSFFIRHQFVQPRFGFLPFPHDRNRRHPHYRGGLFHA